MLHQTSPSTMAVDGGGSLPPYVLAFSDDRELSKPGYQTLVRVRDGAEMANLAGLLGDSCEIALSKPYIRRQSARSEEARQLIEHPPRLSFPLDIEALREILRRLPLALNALVGTGLALDDSDSLPDPIDRRYVHKKRLPTS
ncbi:hypothetical protein [Endothiovibrio diazotrophicus]